MRRPGKQSFSRGGRLLRHTDALGNALGNSFAYQADGRSAANSQGDPLGDFIAENMQRWEQRQANYDQIVSAFGVYDGEAVNRRNDVQLAGSAETKLSDAIGWIEKGIEKVAELFDDHNPQGWWKKAQDWQIQNPDKAGEMIRLGDIDSIRHNGEKLALKDYLSQIPEELSIDETTMARVVKGFPEYFDRHLSLQIAAAKAGVASDTWLFGAGAGVKALELAELGMNSGDLVKSAADLGRLSAEQLMKSPSYSQLEGLPPGPQIFTKTLYEDFFGKPTKGWAAYQAWEIKSQTKGNKN